MSTCHNNPKKSSTTKINKRTTCVYSLFTHCSFDTTENKLYYYRDKNYMKNISLDLRVPVTKIINYGKKEMIPLRKEEKKIHRRQKKRYICQKKKLVLMIIIKNIIKSETIVIILENIEELLMIFVI